MLWFTDWFEGMSNVGTDIFEKELYELTPEQAREVLNAFLQEERDLFRTLKIKEINLDYSKDSLVRLFKHAINEIRASGKSESQYDHVWSLRLAYYFGEALKRNANRLDWGIGNPDYAFANHSVITGFRKKQEAALITIARNIISAVVFGNEDASCIVRAVDAWFEEAELVGSEKR